MGGKELTEYSQQQPLKVNSYMFARIYWCEIDYDQGEQQLMSNAMCYY